MGENLYEKNAYFVVKAGGKLSESIALTTRSFEEAAKKKGTDRSLSIVTIRCSKSMMEDVLGLPRKEVNKIF